MSESVQRIVVGCNYHTTWQSHTAMRFILKAVVREKALLTTRGSQKEFWTDLKDLIFIESAHNCRKANEIQMQELSYKHDMKQKLT